MLTYFSIRFKVIGVIALLTVSAIPTPKLSGKDYGIPIPLTRQSPSLNSNKSVNINGLKSRAASYMAKILHGLENYERNMGTAHPYVLKRSVSLGRKRDVIGLDLTSHDDEVWYGTISIGTPPKLFTGKFSVHFLLCIHADLITVQVDTGFSDLFVPASNGDAVCKSHDNLWNPASSKTAQDLGNSFELKFGDGAIVKGKQYTDDVTIAGFTADEQTIGVATTYSANLDKLCLPSDGMLGLAFPSISKYPASPLLQTLVSQGKLPDGVFSFRFTPDGGEMYIGGVNEELYTGDITFVDVQTTGFWQVMVDDIRINGRPVLSSIVSVIDTGANYIYGDRDRVLTLHQAYGGQAFGLEEGYYTFPCDRVPDVTFTFGGKPFTILADDLNLGPVENGSPDCFSGIMAHDENGVSAPTFWAIGANFIRLFYTVFNIVSDPPQVGFAQL